MRERPGRASAGGTDGPYPEGLIDFFAFLCRKYGIEEDRITISYSSDSPPPIVGNRPGYYDGLLSYRERFGRPEFLITVFKVARDPLLTLGHEFLHLVDDLGRGGERKRLAPPDDEREREFDRRAVRDLDEFRALRSETE